MAIFGWGTIGLLLLLIVQEHGIHRVICTDLKTANLSPARTFGAADVVCAPGESLDAAIQRETGGAGVDATFIVAGADAVVRDALRATAPGGRAVVVAMFDGPSTVDLRQVQLAEREMVGTAMYNRLDFEEAIELVTFLESRLQRMITSRIALKALPATFERLVRGDHNKIKVMVTAD